MESSNVTLNINNLEELETIYNALGARKCAFEEDIVKYKKQGYDNSYHREEAGRCKKIMKYLEPFLNNAYEEEFKKNNCSEG